MIKTHYCRRCGKHLRKKSFFCKKCSTVIGQEMTERIDRKMAERCDHKFIDTKFCIKCGFIPKDPFEGMTEKQKRTKLFDDIVHLADHL